MSENELVTPKMGRPRKFLRRIYFDVMRGHLLRNFIKEANLQRAKNNKDGITQQFIGEYMWRKENEERGEMVTRSNKGSRIGKYERGEDTISQNDHLPIFVEFFKDHVSDHIAKRFEREFNKIADYEQKHRSGEMGIVRLGEGMDEKRHVADFFNRLFQFLSGGRKEWTTKTWADMLLPKCEKDNKDKAAELKRMLEAVLRDGSSDNRQIARIIRKSKLHYSDWDAIIAMSSSFDDQFTFHE